MTGDFAAIAEQASAGTVDYSAVSMSETWALCQALVKTRSFAEFDRCVAALDAKVAAENGALLYMVDGALGNEFYSVGATAQGMITRVKAEAALSRGDAVEAARYAEQLAMLARTYDYPFDRRYLNPGNDDGYRPRGQGDESAYSSVQRRNHLAEALGTLGLVAARRGDADQALDYAQQIAAIDSAGMNATQWRLPETKALWIARIAMTLGAYEEAYNAMATVERNSLFGFVEGLANAVSLVNPIFVIQYAEMTGGLDMEALYFTRDFEPRFLRYRAALETGRLSEAREGFDSILEERRVRGYGTVYWQALYGRGRIALDDGDLPGAIEYFQRAIDVIEAQRQSLETEAGRVGYVGDKQEVYADLVAVLIDAGRVEDAFDYAERAKARALVDLLASRSRFPVSDAQGGAGDSTVDMTDTIRRLDGLERESLRLAATDTPAAVRRKADLIAARTDLQVTAPELASLVTVAETDIEGIQARIAADELMLHYFGYEERLFAFVVTNSKIEVVKLDGADLASDVARTRRAVQNLRSASYERPVRKLYDRLIRPLEGKLSGRKLIIVPHGTLHYLPFMALSDGDGYLIDRFEIRLLPSAGVLAFLEKPAEVSGSLLALGNPDLGDPRLDLPGAQVETEAIDRGWPTSRVLLRRVASEANFRTFAPGFRYLHLASHGEFNPEEPLQSQLLLAPGGGHDGRLTVNELYDIRLNADLVTLSACETGLGDVQSGDDVIGLTRGFLYAGTRSVVTSLWPVSDAETAFLMQIFYDGLKQRSVVVALRQAILKTKARYPHPAYWAAFNLTGAP